MASIPRSAKERRIRRWRLGLLIGKCLLVTTAVVWGLAFAFQVWKEWFATHPDYAVGHFGYRSNVAADHGGLSRETILDVTGLREDTNVMRVNLASIQAAIGALPQVSKVEVERFFPNKIDISVMERQPVAWLACGPKDIQPKDSQKGRLLDGESCVFECRSLLNVYQNLPVINVPTLSWAESGHALVDHRALQAVALVTAFSRQQWPVPLRILQVETMNSYAMTAELSDHASVVFSYEEIETQVNRLRLIYEHSILTHRSVASVNLLPKNNVPVTYFAPGQTAESPGGISSPAQPTAAAGSVGTESPPSSTPASRASRPTSRNQVSPSASSREERDVQAIVRGT